MIVSTSPSRKARFVTTYPIDENGVIIEPGDLVVSKGVLGTVKAINGWGSINVRYKAERALYAYEEGALDIPYQYKPYHWNRETRQYEYGEEETRYEKDYRSIGRKIVERTQVRVSKDQIMVLRKHTGVVPAAITTALNVHEIVFPTGGVKDGE